MREHAFTDREPVCPHNWMELDGWRGEPAIFLNDLMSKIRLTCAEHGYLTYWVVQDFHRMMSVEPYIMLGVRPASSPGKSILIAFGFSYASARTWPKGFAEEYARQICECYDLFEDDVMMPPKNPSETFLDRFCAKYGVKRELFTLEPGHFPHIKQALPKAAKVVDPFEEMETATASDPFEELEQEDDPLA